MAESMLGSIDWNLIGIFVVPIGVVFCFGPALVVWLRAEFRAGRAPEQGKDRPG